MCVYVVRKGSGSNTGAAKINAYPRTASENSRYTSVFAYANAALVLLDCRTWTGHSSNKHSVVWLWFSRPLNKRAIWTLKIRLVYSNNCIPRLPATSHTTWTRSLEKMRKEKSTIRPKKIRETDDGPNGI